jgi:hypothetical protein
VSHPSGSQEGEEQSERYQKRQHGVLAGEKGYVHA